jgi:flagellar FliL protein
MGTTATATNTDAPAELAVPAGKWLDRRRLILFGGPLALAGLLVVLWFGGVLPRMLGLAHAPAKQADAAPPPPVYLDLPELVSNLAGNPHRPSYVKVTVRLELGGPADVERVKQALPRLQDLALTYLREMHPEELSGSAGTERLREELLNRASAAAAPARIKNVLFIGLLVQ